MIIVLLLGTPIFVGLVAQKGKGRMGALWGAITLAVVLLLWVFIEFGIRITDPAMLVSPDSGLIIGIMACGIGGFAMLVIVGSLPRGKAPEGTHRCPHCAEMIQPAAKVCKHCGRDVQPGTKQVWKGNYDQHTGQKVYVSAPDE